MVANADTFHRALNEGGAEGERFEGVSYVRVVDDRRDAVRGEVRLGERTVPVYPSIGRVFVLREGVRANLAGPFVAEEKIDGYNVRIVRHDGRLLAFTRGGYVCPFTTDRLPDLAELGPLFDEDPDRVLCAEIAGPHNPYLHARVPHVQDDVSLFAFDLMRLDEEGFLPFEERHRVLERHGVPRTPLVGRFSPERVDELAGAVRRLHTQGSEGVVLKPLGEGTRVKYVTPASNLQDVAEDAHMLAELPAEFFTGRMLRLAIGLEELGLERDALLSERLGRALIDGGRATIREFRKTGIVAQEHTVRFCSEHRIDALLDRLGQSSVVTVRELARERRGEHIEVTFRKTFQRATGYLSSLLRGKAVVD